MHHGLQSATLGRSWTPVAPSPALPAIRAQPASRVSQSPVTVTAWSQEPLPAGASGREPGPGRGARHASLPPSLAESWQWLGVLCDSRQTAVCVTVTS